MVDVEVVEECVVDVKNEDVGVVIVDVVELRVDVVELVEDVV